MVRTSQSSAYLLQNAVSNPQDQANVAPLWFTTDGGTSWSERSIPCAVGSSQCGSIALSAAPDGTLLAVCAGEPGAGSQEKSALRSIQRRSHLDGAIVVPHSEPGVGARDEL